MTMEAARSAIAQIRASPSGSFFVGERSEELVSSAEEALGFDFPDSYRLFVCELGAGNVGPNEVFGVTSDNFVSSAIPNGVWLTLDVRQTWGLSPTMLVVYFDGAVDYFVMDCALANPPLLLWRPGQTTVDTNILVAAENFGTFLLELVRQHHTR